MCSPLNVSFQLGQKCFCFEASIKTSAVPKETRTKAYAMLNKCLVVESWRRYEWAFYHGVFLMSCKTVKNYEHKSPKNSTKQREMNL